MYSLESFLIPPKIQKPQFEDCSSCGLVQTATNMVNKAEKISYMCEAGTSAFSLR